MGYLLKGGEPVEIKYFYPSGNTAILPKPFLITEREDIVHLKRKLEEIDLVTYITSDRPDTSYSLLMLTNINWSIYRTSFPLGKPSQVDNFIKSSVNVHSLQRDRNGRLYKDSYCLQRCLALNALLELGYKWKTMTVKRLEIETKKLVKQYLLANQLKACNFNGISIQQLARCEFLYSININAFTLSNTDSACNVASPIYLSMNNYKKSANLHVVGRHYGLIKNMKLYAKKFKCMNCDMMFQGSNKWKIHQAKCSTNNKLIYREGYFCGEQTIFQELQSYNIHVSDTYIEEFVFADLECMLIKPENWKNIDEVKNTDALTYLNRHQVISAALGSNLKEFSEPIVIIDPDEKTLVDKILSYLENVREVVEMKARNKFSKVFVELERLINKWEKEMHSPDCADRNVYRCCFLERYRLRTQTEIKKLYDKFTRYCSELVVLFYNGSNYDIPIIRNSLIEALGLVNAKKVFVIKRGSRYQALCNEQFRFLDVLSYLPAHTSYRQFLKSFHISENKGFFCYEFLDSIAKLNYDRLPDYNSFYSNLKGYNILEEEKQSFDKLLKSGLNEQQALDRLHMKEIPLSGEDNYKLLQDLWCKKGMQTLADLLVHYSCLDISPGIEAIELMRKYYKKKGISIFKDTISAAGAARLMLFRCARKNNCSFATMNYRDSDLHTKIDRSITGGASIIYKRYAKIGEKMSSGQICKSIIGWDCNSLYLFHLKNNLPTSFYVRRKKENGFKGYVSPIHGQMFLWMNYLQKKFKLKIDHKMNTGYEQRAGCFYLDGFSPEFNICFEYQSCFFHAHDCLSANTFKKYKKFLTGKRQHYERKMEFLKSIGLQIVEIWHCQFLKLLKVDPALAKFVKSCMPNFYNKFPGKVNTKQIISAVKDETFFGFLDADFCVPEKWPNDITLDEDMRNSTPYEFFSEMCPLYGNTTIPFSDYGEHMQSHIRRHNKSKKPKRLLISGMKSKRLMIGSELARFYLQKGLIITDIYEITEFCKYPCFYEFTQDITKSRRNAGKDPIKSSLAKYLGNSSYGSLLLKRQNFCDLKYVRGEVEATKCVNQKRFVKLESLKHDIYEIQSSKQKVIMKNPHYVAHYILCQAKLTILRFYFDFLKKYMKKGSYEMLESDTDSMYVSLSGPDLLSCVKEERKSEFLSDLYSHCNEESIDAKKFFLPRLCCKLHNQFDLKEPGLWKEEFSSVNAEDTCMVSLCSKTYAVGNSEHYKFSCKGVNRNSIKDIVNTYKYVLDTSNSIYGQCRGFRKVNKHTYSYEQTKIALNYVYVKRVVQAGGIETKPLPTVICPYTPDELICLEKRCGPGCAVKLFCKRKYNKNKIEVSSKTQISETQTELVLKLLNSSK
jgi:hypothetical protein